MTFETIDLSDEVRLMLDGLGIGYRLGQMSEAVDIAFGRHDHGSMACQARKRAKQTVMRLGLATPGP